MSTKSISIPHLGHNIVLVKREQLRRKPDTKKMSVPGHMRSWADSLPTPTATIDWSKGNTLQYPILGNDQRGDCFYAAACHQAQTWTGNSGKEATFDAKAVVARYLKIAGGDNGLSDDQIFPEWVGGIVGPNGPHKILDDMVITATDATAVKLGMYLFGGAIYTAGLLDAWLNNPQPGDVWDAVGKADENNGHAMHLSGINSKGNYLDQTWGFNPPIEVTQKGLAVSDPEIVVSFSLDWFNAQGVAPNGFSYDQLAHFWVQLGGKQLPSNPFVVTPPPVVPPSPPVVPPVPPAPPVVPPVPPHPPAPPVPPVPPPQPGTWQIFKMLMHFIEWLRSLLHSSHVVSSGHDGLALDTVMSSAWSQIIQELLSAILSGSTKILPILVADLVAGKPFSEILKDLIAALTQQK